MKKLSLILLAGASLSGTAEIAAAQYYYDRPGYGDPYRGRYYDDGYYQRRGYAYGGAIVGHDRYGRRELYYPVGRGGRCPPHYTIQDGICKPYRGY